jgi:hypothetical protein
MTSGEGPGGDLGRSAIFRILESSPRPASGGIPGGYPITGGGTGYTSGWQPVRDGIGQAGGVGGVLASGGVQSRNSLTLLVRIWGSSNKVYTLILLCSPEG